ncbi:hypothetical protein KY285_025493 [Solanum tuberosum]|nr:hypothetical protein KY289_024175 [Solanum tuberosum]KAH0677692.1 hypothetical protein KY285_025493 [Solanum tuberosum]
MMKNIHISNDSETADVSPIPPPEKKRKGRGKTTGLSTQKKRKENDNGKLKVIIPPDQTVAVGPGAKDFITELSVKVLHNARHDVKNWKGVPDLANNRIVAYMLDTFQLPDIQHNRDTILQTAKNLYRYRRSRHHDHFKIFATKEESLQNIPTDVNEAEWKFLDKMKDVAENIQEIEEGTDVDPIINAAFVQIMGEKSKYILGQGSGIKSASRISRNEIQEQLQAQQKEAEEERRKRESVESKLMEVMNQLEEERKNREVMEVRLVHDQKLLKESMMALVSHLQNPKNGLLASIFNIITTSTSSNETSSASLMNNNWAALTEKRSLEMRLPKLSSQGSKKTIPKELVDANNQVFEKIHEELKARSMLRTAEETIKRLLSEKSSLEEKIVELEKKKSSEGEHA